MQRIREQGERMYELACRTLALLALLQMLFLTDAQHLLSEGDMSQYPDIDTVLQCCHGLIQRSNLYRLVFVRV